MKTMTGESDELLVIQAEALNPASLPTRTRAAITTARRIITEGRALSDKMRSTLSVAIIRAETMGHGNRSSHTSHTPAHVRPRNTAPDSEALLAQRQYKTCGWCWKQIRARRYRADERTIHFLTGVTKQLQRSGKGRVRGQHRPTDPLSKKQWKVVKKIRDEIAEEINKENDDG